MQNGILSPVALFGLLTVIVGAGVLWITQAAGASSTGLGDSDAPHLAITYYDYPPNIMDVDGRPRGLFVTKLKRIADKAGFRIVWQRSSVEEEVRMLNDGKRAFCTSGKLFSEDRARQWIYIPYVFAFASANIVIAHPSVADRVSAHSATSDLVRDHRLKGALLSGATYGGRIDRFLRTDRPLWVLQTGRSDQQLLTLVAMARADYAIVQERQWQMALATDPSLGDLVNVAGLRELAHRPIYLACSRTLEMSVVRSLADAMASLGFPYQELHFQSVNMHR